MAAVPTVNRQQIGHNTQEICNKLSDLASAFQSGSATLVAGQVTVSSVTLTAASVVLVSRKTQGGTVTSTIVYEAPSSGRNVGASTLLLQASVAAGTANAADTSVVDWFVYG